MEGVVINQKRRYIKAKDLTPEEILVRATQRKEYMKNYMKENYAKNKEKIKESVKKYQEENKEKKKENDKKYYEEHKEEIKEKTKRNLDLVNLVNKINAEKMTLIMDLLRNI